MATLPCSIARRAPELAGRNSGNHLRNRPGVQAVPTTLSGVRQMIKALRKGEAVGLLPDQGTAGWTGRMGPIFRP